MKRGKRVCEEIEERGKGVRGENGEEIEEKRRGEGRMKEREGWKKNEKRKRELKNGEEGERGIIKRRRGRGK